MYSIRTHAYFFVFCTLCENLSVVLCFTFFPYAFYDFIFLYFLLPQILFTFCQLHIPTSFYLSSSFSLFSCPSPLPCTHAPFASSRPYTYTYKHPPTHTHTLTDTHIYTLSYTQALCTNCEMEDLNIMNNSLGGEPALKDQALFLPGGEV